MKGCSLGAGIDAQVRSIFGPYAVAFHGSGHTARVFLPNGAPLTEKMGMVWCRFNRTADLASEYLLIRHQVYATTSAAEEGFSLALNMQDKATPDNAYSVTKRGKLTLAVRKYGEVMALR
jgi:hypothetical protein